MKIFPEDIWNSKDLMVILRFEIKAKSPEGDALSMYPLGDFKSSSRLYLPNRCRGECIYGVRSRRSAAQGCRKSMEYLAFTEL